MTRRKACTQEDIDDARDVLADFEKTMPVDLAVETAARHAVIRELNHLLALSMACTTAGEVRGHARRLIRLYEGDVRPARRVSVRKTS